MNILFTLFLLLASLISIDVSAITINASSTTVNITTDTGLIKLQGNYQVDAYSLARDVTGSHSDFGLDLGLKANLPNNTQSSKTDADVRALNGSQNGNVSFRGNGLAESWATSPTDDAWAHAYSIANSNLGNIGGGIYVLHAYADVNPNSIFKPYSKAIATFKDPDYFEWSDDLEHAFNLEWTLSDAIIATDTNTIESAFHYDSFLDFGNDGIMDQVFWSLDIKKGEGVNLVLGDDVFLSGGLTEFDVENVLNAFWLDPDNFLLTSDFSIGFNYKETVSGAGAMAISYNGSALAVDAVPEPAIALLLSLGVLVMGASSKLS